MPSTQPGSGDPYWYEWYVGLDRVIDLIAGRDGIESVTFQEANLTGIDDVVVRYRDNRGATCYQVKFKKATTESDRSITFSTLVSKRAAGKRSLIGELAEGWEQLSASEAVPPDVVLYSNRAYGTSKSTRSYRDSSYNALPLLPFKERLDGLLKQGNLTADSELGSYDLNSQWQEFLDAVELPSDDACEFLRHLRLDLEMPGLDKAEDNLIAHVQHDICAGDYGLAHRCFEALCSALRQWTISGERNTVTRQIAEKVLLGLNESPLEKPIDVEIPTPIFPSRQAFAEELCEEIERSDRTVIFIEAEPGAGKTRLVTSLCRMLDPAPFRFYSFKPLDVDQLSYSPDSGVTSARDLWSTMLNQLRNVLDDSNSAADSDVPIINELCTEDQLRSETLRLSGILAELREKPTTLIIDGIDHAARAMGAPTYLQHLPAPDAIPDGVRIILVGQPATSYESYPMWLRMSNDSVEHFSLPRLKAEDAGVLLEAQTPLCGDDAEEVAAALITQTKGNALSVVYAVHALKAETSAESAIAALEESGISDNVEEYYRFVWTGMVKSMEARSGVDDSMLIASCMYLLDGFVSTRLLSDAFPDEYPKEYLAETDLRHLCPLLQQAEDGSYFPIHNDFRLYVSGMAKNPGNEPRLKYATAKLASYMLEADNPTIRCSYGVPTLIRAGRADDAIDMFDTGYVMTAVSIGVPWKVLSDQASLVYDAACKTGSLAKVHKVVLSIETLGQINERFQYYLDDRPFLKLKQPTYLDFDVTPLSPEPETVAAYVTALRRCVYLQESGAASSAATIYDAWFGGKRPRVTAQTILRRGFNAFDSISAEEGKTLFSLWGEYSAVADIEFEELECDFQTGDGDADDLIQAMRDGYVRTSVERDTIEVTKERLRRIGPSFDCCRHMVERHLNGEKPLKRDNLSYLLKGIIKADQTDALDATARVLTAIDGKPVRGSRSLAHSDSNLRFYCESEEADAYVIRAFLFGYANGRNSIQEAVNEARRLMSWVDPGDRSYPTFIQGVTAATCLGWHFAQSDGKSEPLQEERLVIEKWLRSDDAIGFKLSTLTILYALLVPAKTRDLRLALDRQLLVGFASSRALVCVLRIFGFLAEVEDHQNLQALLRQHYGKDGSKVLRSDDSKTVHDWLRPYLAMIDPELCSLCDAALEYNVSQVSDDHREHALAHITETFNSLLQQGMTTEAQARQFYALDKASRRPGGNYMAEKTRDGLLRWASAGGARRLAKLRKWDAELRYDESALAALSEAALKAASSAEGIAAAAALRIGASSYYSTGELASCSAFLESCTARAKELGVSDKQVARLMELLPHCPTEQAGTPPHVEASAHTTLSEYERREKEREQRISQLAADKLEEVAYVAPINDREWGEVSTACSCMVERGRNPKKVFTELATNRRLELASFGAWQNYSKALIYLIDAVTDFADDDAFFGLLTARHDNLTSYGYGSTSDDLAYVLNRRVEKNAPSLLASFFEDEFESKRLWLTANGRLPAVSYPREGDKADLPQDLAGLAAESLIDQLVAQNPRMCENALRGLAWGGLVLEGIRVHAYCLCGSYESSERIMLYKLFGYWRDMALDTDSINDLFERSLGSSVRLDEASLLCVLLRKPTVECLATQRVSAGDTSGQVEGNYAGRGKTFLRFAERWPGQFDALRAELRALPLSEEDFEAKPFTQSGDIYCPRFTGEALEMEALYRTCAHDGFGDLPSDIATSLLVDPSDIWAIAASPMICSAEEDGMSSLIEDLETGKSIDIDQVRDISARKLAKGERLLGWKAYLPYGHDMEYAAVEASRMNLDTSVEIRVNTLDREFGCYGVLAKDGGGVCIGFGNGNSVSLCNEVTGSISLMWGDVQLVPSRTLRSLGLEPNHNNPLEWLDGDGAQALRFDRYLYLIRDHYDREGAYYRQPQVWQWVCSAKLLGTLISALEPIIYTSIETTDERDVMKKRVDDWRIEASSSPL